MLGQWVESWLSGGVDEALLTDAATSSTNLSLQSSLPGVTMFVDDHGYPVLSHSRGQALSRERLKLGASSGSPSFQASPCRRRSFPEGVPEMYCIHTPDEEALRAVSSTSRAGPKAIALDGLPSFISSPPTLTSSPATSERSTNSPSYIAYRRNMSPSICSTPNRAAPAGSPEMNDTRRALWLTPSEVSGPSMQFPMVDWSMPSSSSWVSMSGARPLTASGSPFLQSPLPKGRRQNSAVTPQSGRELAPGWPITPKLHVVRQRSASSGKRRRASGQPGLCTPKAELLFASPITSRSAALGDVADSAHHRHSTLRAVAAEIRDLPQVMPAPEKQKDLSTRRSPRSSPRAAPPMADFRKALWAAEGLDSPLRQDLLQLVDHLEEPIALQTVETSSRKESEIFPSPSQKKVDLGIPVADHWGESLCRCGSASPTQSDVEAALHSMDTPSSTPRSSRSTHLGDVSPLLAVPADRENDMYHSRSVSKLDIVQPSWPESPSVKHVVRPETESPVACTPLSLHQRRNAMWLGPTPPLLGSEEMTPDAIPEDLQGSQQRRSTSLAKARDQFKLSIGACERSRQFRSAVLSELGALADPAISDQEISSVRA